MSCAGRFFGIIPPNDPQNTYYQHFVYKKLNEKDLNSFATSAEQRKKFENLMEVEPITFRALAC